MAKTTQKKVRYVGKQEFIDATTGELIEMQVTRIEDRDFNFSKVWLRDFLRSLDIVSNTRTRVAYWVIEHVNRDNLLPYTYRQIAAEMGVSLDTVRITMGALLEADFLRKHNAGCYIINPDIVFKGTRAARMNVLTQYAEANKGNDEVTDAQRLAAMMASIQRLTEQANKLAAKIEADKAAEADKNQITLDEAAAAAAERSA